MGFPAVTVRLAALAVFAGALSCRGASSPETRSTAPPSPSAGTNSSVIEALSGADSGESTIAHEGMPRVEVVLDDPRLTVARERHEAADDGAAAREIERVLATATLDRSRACAWSYVAGRLHVAANEPGDAASVFEHALGADAGPPCPLSAYARLRLAEALIRASRCDEALAQLHDVQDIAAEEEVHLTTADALVGKADRTAAVLIWRTLLASSPHGVRWVDTSMQLARALLDGVDGPPTAHAQEALDLATRVLVEAPQVADKVDAASVRDRAASVNHRVAPPLDIAERARQAQAWLDASQPKRAHQVADALLRAIPLGAGEFAEIACKTATVRAQATPHGKAVEAADAWGLAIARCRGDDALATALYQGAKASAAAKRNAEALSRFAQVEKRFPRHRLADDARFRAAQLVEDQGDAGAADAMLSSIADVYPDGDMGGDALFRVALDKLDGREIDAARALLDRLLGSAPDSLSWGAASRAAYFRARLAQLAGEVEDAKTRYAAIVASRPLSYYMLLAYARLRGLDDGLARATLEGAVQREPPGRFLTRPHPELTSAVFERFVRLLEVGEIDAARREASAGGLTADSGDLEVLWAVAWAYDRAGAVDLGHGLTRGRLVDYRTHWPAGRWRLGWEVAFPRPWSSVVLRESDAAQVPPPLTWAIMREESAFNPEARSNAGALGLMQLMSSTARLVARGTPLPTDEDALRRPDVSIALGTRLLATLRTSFASHPALAVAAYNGGTVAVHRWQSERSADDFDVFVERIPFDETRNYVKRVLASQAAYAYLYAPAAFDELLGLL